MNMRPKLRKGRKVAIILKTGRFENTDLAVIISSTRVANILQWGVENDVIFDHTLYTRTDAESFGGGGVILNQVEY